MSNCTNCGTPLSPGSRFCGNCGTPAPVAPPAQAPPAAPEATVVLPPQGAGAAPPPGYPPAYPPPAPGPPPPPGYPSPATGAAAPAPAYPPSPAAPQVPGAYVAPGYPPGGPPPVPPGQAPPGRSGPSPAKVLLFAVVALVVALVVLLAGILVVPRIFGDGGGGETAMQRADGVPIFGSGPSSAPTEAWKKDIGDCDDAECTLAADADNVYVGKPGEDGDFVLTAYDASSGDQRWKKSLESVDSLFLFAIESGVLALYDNDDTALLDPADGSETWKVDGIAVNFHGEDVIVRESDDETVKSRLIDTATGDERWAAEGAIYSCGSTLAVSDDDRVELRDESGKSLWDHEIDSGLADGQVWCSDDVLAYPAGEDELGVLATADGAERGTIEVVFDERHDTFVRESTVYVVENDNLVAHNAEGSSPEQAWKAEWSDEHTSAFYVDDGVLVVDEEDKAEIFAYDDGTSVAFAPLSGYETFLDSTEGLIGYGKKVTLFGADDLKSRWSTDAPVDVDDIEQLTIGGDRLFVLTDDEVLAYS